MIRRALLPLVAMIALYAPPAAAQGVCGDRAAMTRKLVDQYGETQMGGGLAGALLLEIWTNCITGTWTILKTYPTGTACVIAAGDNWHGKGCKPGQPV